MSQSYTVKEINSDGNVVVQFEGDTHSQTLVDAPTDSVENFQAFMIDYTKAYLAGKEIEVQTISQGVKSLVGKKQTVEE